MDKYIPIILYGDKYIWSCYWRQRVCFINAAGTGISRSAVGRVPLCKRSSVPHQWPLSIWPVHEALPCRWNLAEQQESSRKDWNSSRAVYISASVRKTCDMRERNARHHRGHRIADKVSSPLVVYPRNQFPSGGKHSCISSEHLIRHVDLYKGVST